MTRHVALALTAFVLGGCASAGAPAARAPAPAAHQDGALARGETLVQRYCGGCHAIAREGASREPTAPPLRDLSEQHDLDVLAKALEDGFLAEHPAMPSFRFSRPDLDAVILYLNSIQLRQRL